MSETISRERGGLEQAVMTSSAAGLDAPALLRAPADTIRTISGRIMRPLDPRPDDIAIEDIAHALSHICRWNGHVREFYSVAHHSVMVAGWCQPEHRLAALLHDAAEAYLSDVPRPLKATAAFAAYREAEARLQRVIFERFGLPPEIPAAVHTIDRWALGIEARDLVAENHSEWLAVRDAVLAGPMRNVRIGWPASIDSARAEFMAAFEAIRLLDLLRSGGAGG